MITWTCNAESCEAHAEWWVGERALCGPHRALAHVQRAHAAILDMAPEDRARFDELCEAWARERAEVKT